MNIKDVIIKNFSFIILTLTAFISCEKEDIIIQEQTRELHDVSDLTLSQKNEMIEQYALILASSLMDMEMRTIIKKEAQLMFDGDYDVLTCKLENSILQKKNIQAKELMAISYEQSIQQNEYLKSCQIDVRNQLEKTNRTFPNLQVAVPVHCDEWNTEIFTPLVAFLPYDFDDSKTNFVFAYDSHGNKHKLSLDQEPDVPVLVVGISERIDENGKRIGSYPLYPYMQTKNLKSTTSGPSGLNISHGPAGTIILEWADTKDETGYELWRMLQPNETEFSKFASTDQNDNGYVNSSIDVGSKVWYKVRAIQDEGYSSWSPIMATTVSPRNDGEWLTISRMRFSTSALKAVESWVSGAPELRLRVVQGSESGASIVYTSGRMEPKRRKDIQDTWWNKEVQIFTWCTNTYGTILSFDWQEEDNISKVDFTVNASYEAKELGGEIKAGGNVKFTADKNGSIGNTSVMWWHAKDQIYDLSGFMWQFKD